MKQINVGTILLLMSLLVVTSCFDEYDGTLKEKPWIAFSSFSSANREKTTNNVEATLVLSGTAPLTSDLTINYTVASANATENVNYTLPVGSGTVVLPAGETSVTFDVIEDVIDNLDIDGNKTITITLSSAGSVNVGFPGPDEIKRTFDVIIVDDDCPFDINDYVGDYDVTMKLDFGFIFAAGTYSGLEATLSAGAGNTLVDPDFGYLDGSGGGRVAIPVTIEIDPVAATTEILGDPFTFLDAMTYDAVYAYGTTPGRRFFTNDDLGVGELASCDKQFTVRALIRREDGTIGQRLLLTYTKK